MKILLKKVKIIDSQSPFHLQTKDVLIENGIYTKIEDSILEEEAKEITGENLFISNGWIDSSCSLGFPGLEERETIKNGIYTAAKSGFTTLMVNPNTNPVADNVSVIQNIQNQSNNEIVTLNPIGAFTQKMQGEDLAELFDMHNNCVTSFMDYKKPISNYNLIKVGLQYLKDFEGILQIYPLDAGLKGKGFVNEGIESTKLGLKGISNLAEFTAVQKIIELVEYTGGKVHFATISTKESVDLIKNAKEKGLAITCSVSVHNLIFTDASLQEFDTNFKVSPPLRTEKDRQALLNGVLDGTIDVICSDHNPMNIEEKDVEFELAKDGTIGLESAFAALNTMLPLEIIVEKLTNAYKVFGYSIPKIDLNKKANVTIFKDSGTYTFKPKNILSSSKNSMFLGKEVKGTVVGVVNNGMVNL